MRIISGKYKGRKLKGYTLDETRPTMDRVKESLFGMIQNYLKEAIVLDLFAGSGALGLEAISNGAKECFLIDNSKDAINIIKENSQNIENVNILNIDYKKYLKTTILKFDVIFLDPPYSSNQLNKALKIIEERDLLQNKGIVICEYEKENPICNLKLIKEKKYGLKTIRIFQKINNIF